MLQFENDESVIKEDFTIQKVYFFFQNIPVSLSHPFLLERVMTEQQKAQNNSTAPNITLKTKRALQNFRSHIAGSSNSSTLITYALLGESRQSEIDNFDTDLIVVPNFLYVLNQDNIF